MREDIKKFFIDKEMVKKTEVEEKHECNCNGECGSDCKCNHKEDDFYIDINAITSKDKWGNTITGIPSEWISHNNTLTEWNVNSMTDIPIRYLEGAKELVINPKGDLIDLYAYEDVFIPYMGYALVSLGFAIQLPEGKMMKIYPRSSTFKTWGCIMTNSVGQIDNSYCGDNDIVHMPVQCTMPMQTEKVIINGHKITVAGTWIKKNDKICQMEIVDIMQKPTFKKVDTLGNYDRGGIGSTGTK